MIRVRAALVLATTVAMVGSSCGGSDSSGSTPSSEAPSVEQIQDLAQSGAVGDIAEAAGVSEACVQLSLAMAAAATGMASATGPGDMDAETLRRSFDAIKSEAPADLAADIDIVEKALVDYMSILSEFGNDVTAMMTDPRAAERFAAAFGDEGFAAASERFGNWLDSVCSG